MNASVPPLGAPETSSARVASSSLTAAALVIVGCGALAARFAVVAATPRPALMLVVLFGVLLLAGALLPLPPFAPLSSIARTSSERRSRGWATAGAALVGVAAFAVARFVVGGHAPMSVSGYAIVTSTIAAVAEEAFFRRLCYGLLEPAGPVFAIAGSSLLFAMVHVAAYGWWVLPVDLAAGALFGWQRLASGSWTAPAITHVLANLLVLL